MKRFLPVVVPTLLVPLALALVAFLAVHPAGASAAGPGSIVSVDYILALLDSGIDQDEIVSRIRDRDLRFRLAPGDIDRLRAAGAEEGLIEAVTGAEVAAEGREGSAAAPGAGTTETDGWERPRRLDNETQGNAPRAGTQEGTEEDEGITEEPEGSYGGYGYYPGYYGYYPGYYGYYAFYGYPYPYYYYPRYYSPFGAYIYYSSPFYGHSFHRHRGFVRGGDFRSAPRGGHATVTPRPRGAARSSPRGSHH